MARKTVRIEPSDRAQLMLVGAVAIALVLVGIVVVYNTVLYSDTQAATATIDDSRQVEGFTDQARDDLRTLAARLNASNNLTEANLNDAVRNWSEVQAMSHATTNPTIVDVDPGTCSSPCDPGSVYEDVTITWQSDDITYRNEMDIQIPNVGLRPTVYFVQGGEIKSIDGNESPVTTFGKTENVKALGTPTKRGSPGFEVPYVNETLTGDTNLKIADSGGNTTVRTDLPGGNDIRSSSTRVGFGEWSGSSRILVTSQSGDLYRVDPTSGSATSITSNVEAVAGVANVDGDRDGELVYVDGGASMRYLNPGGSDESMGSSVASLTGVGVGPVADLDADSISVAVTVAPIGSNDIRLVGTEPSRGGERTATISLPGTGAGGAPAVADVDEDGDPEIVYVSNSCAGGAEVKYVDDVTTDGSPGNDVKPLVDDTGSPVTAACGPGVVS